MYQFILVKDIYLEKYWKGFTYMQWYGFVRYFLVRELCIVKEDDDENLIFIFATVCIDFLFKGRIFYEADYKWYDLCKSSSESKIIADIRCFNFHFYNIQNSEPSIFSEWETLPVKSTNHCIDLSSYVRETS